MSFVRCGILTLLMGVLGACASDNKSKSPSGPDTRADGSFVSVPQDSPLAKVHADMGDAQVRDILGPPKDTGSHTTGKQFNPFYYGGDTVRLVYYYPKLGRVIFSRDNAFSSEMRVIGVEYDPTEDGYK